MSGGFIRAGDGRAVIPRGVNLSGQHKYAPYFSFQQAPDYARVRSDWGYNSIRFVLVWAAIEPSLGQYDSAYLDKVAERIAWAKAANLLVILDMHQDVYGEGFANGGGDGAPRWTCPESTYATFKPQSVWTMNYLTSEVQSCYDGFWGNLELKAHYVEAWRQVAARLASFDNIVGFDIMNEPFWGSHTITKFEHDFLMPLYEVTVQSVRSAAPGWVAFIEPSAARNATGPTNLPTPTFKNFVYSPHSYDVLAETGAGFDSSRRDAILSNLAALRQEANTLGGALWIGEYGGKATSDGIVPYMVADEDGISAAAAGSSIWNYSKGNYGLLAEDGSEQQAYVTSVLRPYPEAVAGTPVSWAYEPVGKTFTLQYHADTNIKAPTVISIAPRLYPDGYKVDCGGCQTQTVGAEVIVTTPPSGDPAVVTIHP